MPELAVRIVGGGPQEWIMVPAQLVGLNMYRLLDFEQSDCDLEFESGSLVTTMPLPDANGNEVLVAHKLFLK